AGTRTADQKDGCVYPLAALARAYSTLTVRYRCGDLGRPSEKKRHYSLSDPQAGPMLQLARAKPKLRGSTVSAPIPIPESPKEASTVELRTAPRHRIIQRCFVRPEVA